MRKGGDRLFREGVVHGVEPPVVAERNLFRTARRAGRKGRQPAEEGFQDGLCARQTDEEKAVVIPWKIVHAARLAGVESQVVIVVLGRSGQLAQKGRERSIVEEGEPDGLEDRHGHDPGPERHQGLEIEGRIGMRLVVHFAFHAAFEKRTAPLGAQGTA